MSQSVTGSRKDVRLEGLSHARQHLHEALKTLKSDGVGPNGRDGWPAERTAKWIKWIDAVRALELEILDESMVICDE